MANCELRGAEMIGVGYRTTGGSRTMKARIFFLFVLIVSLALMPGAAGILAQGPEPGGMGDPAAAQQQAQDVELVGQIGGDIHDVVLQGHYAYVAVWNRGLRIINVSDPAHPTEAGFYDRPG